MRNNESCYVICPFYKSETQGKICCDGIIPGQTIHMVFQDSKQKRKYMKEKCCTYGYGICPLCQMLSDFSERVP